MNPLVLKTFNEVINKRDISDNTKKTYFNNFKKINVLLDNASSIEDFKDISKVLKVSKKLGKQQQKQIYNILGLVLNDKRYKDLTRDITKDIIKISEKNKMSDRQKEKLISYKKLKEKLKKIKKEDKDHLLAYLQVMPLFTPRASDYLKMKVAYKTEDINKSDNFIIYNEKKNISVILQKYKTAKFFGRIIHTFNKKDSLVIKNHLDKNNKPLVLFNYNRQSMHKKLNKLLGISNSFIRTIKNDYLVKSKALQKLSVESKKKKMIELFQHSLSEGESTYRKINLKNN